MRLECAVLIPSPKHLGLLDYTQAAQLVGAYVRWRTELQARQRQSGFL